MRLEQKRAAANEKNTKAAKKGGKELKKNATKDNNGIKEPEPITEYSQNKKMAGVKK